MDTHPDTPVLTDDLLWDTATQAALGLPGSELYPFAVGWDAARVRGKWFMISTIHGTRIVNVKADPVDVLVLCENFESIGPGYHMNKKHWITIAPGPDVTVGMVRELIRDSYQLVVASLPKNIRPVIG